MQNKKIIRWILVVPSAIVGWFSALFLGMALVSVADYCCPPELVLSGACTATWYSNVVDALVVFGASISAVLAILCGVLMAPGQRKMVARVVFATGLAFALYATILTSAWSAFSSAGIAGFITTMLVQRANVPDSA
jgi:hypothetical protein